MAEKVVSLSKDFWMPDVMAKACYKCEKSFNSFRRKHHCRYCGLLFCANCSKLNIEIKNGVKLDRTCDKCLGILSMPEIKPVAMAQYPYFPKDNSIFVEDEQDDAATETNNDPNIDYQRVINEDIEIYAENNDDGDFQNDEALDNYLFNRSKVEMQEITGSDEIESLASIIKEVVKNVKLSEKDSMNITKYFRIVSFPVENKFKFFKGIVFKRILANRRMATKISSPRILILSSSTGFFLGEKKIVSMQKLIEQEENYTKIFLELITNVIKPDLILVEKTMPFAIIDELAKFRVAVLLNVKKKILKLISRLTSAKILSSINQSLYQNSEYLGFCSEFHQKKIGNKVFCFFQAAESTNLCGTVLINSSIPETKALKEVIKRLSVQYRSVLLEKSLLDLFSITKVNYEDFHSFGSKFIFLSTCRGKICSRPKIHQVEYYSKNGKSLGDYLKFNLMKVHEKCQNFCDKKLFDHKYYYFKSNGRVAISYSKSEAQEKNLIVSRTCLFCPSSSGCEKLTSLA